MKRVIQVVVVILIIPLLGIVAIGAMTRKLVDIIVEKAFSS